MSFKSAGGGKDCPGRHRHSQRQPQPHSAFENGGTILVFVLPSTVGQDYLSEYILGEFLYAKPMAKAGNGIWIGVVECLGDNREAHRGQSPLCHPKDKCFKILVHVKYASIRCKLV